MVAGSPAWMTMKSWMNMSSVMLVLEPLGGPHGPWTSSRDWDFSTWLNHFLEWSWSKKHQPLHIDHRRTATAGDRIRRWASPSMTTARGGGRSAWGSWPRRDKEASKRFSKDIIYSNIYIYKYTIYNYIYIYHNLMFGFWCCFVYCLVKCVCVCVNSCSQGFWPH